MPTRQLPDAFGGFCDVYEGTLASTVKVCIKRLRISVGDQEKVKEVSIHAPLRQTIIPKPL